jgi:hypothetical protein
MSAVRWGMLSTAGIERMVALAVRGSGDTRFVADVTAIAATPGQATAQARDHQ